MKRRLPHIDARRPKSVKREPPQDPDKKFWNFVNKDPKTTELFLYDEISYWGINAQIFAEELSVVDTDNITVRVNSPGGDVFDGIAIANLLRTHPAHITCQIDALAASIASVIAMAGDEIVMGPNSQIMIHDASGICVGNCSDMIETSKLLDMLSNNIASAYANRAGGDAAEWRNAMKKESWYNAEEAVAAGLADSVVTEKPKKTCSAKNGTDLAARVSSEISSWRNNFKGFRAPTITNDMAEVVQGSVALAELAEPVLEKANPPGAEPIGTTPSYGFMETATETSDKPPMAAFIGEFMKTILNNRPEPDPVVPAPSKERLEPIHMDIATIKRALREARF